MPLIVKCQQKVALSLFIPFGFFVYFKEKGNKKAVLIFCLIFTVCIEICQLILPMRQTDIDDLILNFLGGYIGMKLAEKYAKIENIKAIEQVEQEILYEI